MGRQRSLKLSVEDLRVLVLGGKCLLNNVLSLSVKELRRSQVLSSNIVVPKISLISLVMA